MFKTTHVKVDQKLHDQLKDAHAREIGRTKTVTTFQKFCDSVLKAGLNGK